MQQDQPADEMRPIVISFCHAALMSPAILAFIWKEEYCTKTNKCVLMFIHVFVKIINI